MSTKEFKDDEKGYLKWLADNPEGYILNIQRGLNPSDARLHRATCWTISSPNGGPWTGQYIKICSTMLEPRNRKRTGFPLTHRAECELKLGGGSSCSNRSRTRRRASLQAKIGKSHGDMNGFAGHPAIQSSLKAPNSFVAPRKRPGAYLGGSAS